MSDIYNIPMPSSEIEEKPSEIIPKKDQKNLHKIRQIIHKNKEVRSQSAPLEEANNDDDAEFLSSYNYYIYYHSKKDIDPHLPKPTYVPKPDLGDIKESKAKDEEDQPKFNNDRQLETINQMMNNLNLDKAIDFNKLLNDDFQNDINSNSKFGINNNELNNNSGFSKLLNNDKNMNNLPQKNKSSLLGDDNFILNNFVNNDNINNINTNNKANLNLNSENNINNIESNLPFNSNNVNNRLNSGIGLNMFDMYNNKDNLINSSSNSNNINLNSNSLHSGNNNNIIINNKNSNNNNNNDFLNMMLFQNIQKEQTNPNFNINYFSQQINNNNILLNNFNNNPSQQQQQPGNTEPNFNIPYQNNPNNYQNDQNNFQNVPNNYFSFNPNQKNYPIFSKNNQKRKHQNNNNNNNLNNYYNRGPNYSNINPKFFPPKNPRQNNTLKNIAGLSDFANSQKRDLTDIKHLEELIQNAIRLNANIANNKSNEISNYQMNDMIMVNKYKNDILSLSKDVTGNYAVQKVLNNKNIPEVNFIIESLKNNIYELTLNLYGCRCVQELISILNVENMNIITSELKPFYEKCILDKNGNHVIQKLIEKVSEEDLNEIYLVAVNNIIFFSKHQYGCRVIQRLFKYCNKDQIKFMLNNLFININDLIQDQYGNYVIQFILENQAINCEELYPIFYSLRGNIYQYSFHKFASNVVERCITFGNEIQKKEIINEVVELVKKDEELIINMVRDRFANYVVQKIIEFSDNDIQQMLIRIIMSRQNKIKNEGFSKHVLNYIEKLNAGNSKGNKIKNNNNIYKQFN